MSGICQQSKRRRTNIIKNITQINSTDPYSDLTFLIGYINTDYIPLLFLLSDRIRNSSFSDLYQTSQQIGWRDTLIKERNDLKLDEKTKPKRFLLNRLIQECSENSNEFNEQLQKLNTQIEKHISNVTSLQSEYYIDLQTIDSIYNDVKSWKQILRERRLFYREYDHLCSLPTLQHRITNLFLLLYRNPNFLQLEYKDILTKLFQHSFIIVNQPSGTDCVAVTKYEKIGNDYLAKLRIRIICLLNVDIINKYLQFSNIDIILFPKDRKLDPIGDKQTSLKWQIRSITCNENNKSMFYYVELNENDYIKLTKMNLKNKLLYNGGLCHFEFQTNIKLNELNIEIPLIFESESFGLCSHPKYYPKYLAKVFIEEINEMYTNINPTTHINMLTGYLCQVHKRISGIDAKSYTRQFIYDKLFEVYQLFQESARSPNGPVMFFSLDIYENILEQLFTQIKFLGNYPFLSMMYYDSLFHGICNDEIDNQLNNGTQERPHVLLRFEIFNKQQIIENPNILFIMFNGEFRKACITHGYFIDDMCRCFYEATENEGNQLQIYADKKILPFSIFHQYYDNNMSRDSLIQIDNGITYYPLIALLRNTIRNTQDRSQILNENENRTYTFNLLGSLSGPGDLTADAIGFLQEKFIAYCRMHDIHGSLINGELDEDFLNNILDDNRFQQ